MLPPDSGASHRAGVTYKPRCSNTPHWNFNWQRGYLYAADYSELSQMGGGDVVRLRCVYDNTMQNQYVAAALADRGLDNPVDVMLGEDTLDEMCVGGLGLIYPNTNRKD